MNGHLTNDQLVDQLYGLAQHQHLSDCGVCAKRWSDLRARREQIVTAAGGESDEFFMAQRARVRARLEKEPRARLGWVPAAVAAACLLAVGLFVHRPAAAPAMDAGDAQLFSDVYSMEQSVEPNAAAPIHALFEDGQ